ncbi:hypothetical protein RHGRI_009599 [Rhododendron griersonianum]|uniref:Uncharacterized protein n=1 Tax=Rhododendron griersonianum TaxID=479676 RepID=A0AAV6KFB8_9ERIC|nr:hypothetical protein RHGRI_009599 [Rhododendron griersonianum]
MEIITKSARAWPNFLSVRLKNGSTESTNNSFPRLPIKRDVAKPRRRPHVGHACATAAPRTGPRHRFAPPHRPLLIHQKAETNHSPPSTE